MHQEKFLIARHSIRHSDGDLESSTYPGISELGVARAAERAQDIWELLKTTPTDTVVFMGGASEAIRTHSTTLALVDNLRRLTAADHNLVFIGQAEIQAEMTKGYVKALQYVRTKIAEHPNSRVLIEFPLYLKQLSLEKNGWQDKDGHDCEFFNALMARNAGERDRALIDWAENRGVIGDLVGPDPAVIGERYSTAVSRIFAALDKLVTDRPVLPIVIGHSWDIDAFLGYIAAGGQIDLPIFNAVVAEGMIKPLEIAKIGFDGITLDYRGRQY